MNRQNWKKAVFVFLVVPFLTGCWNMKELEHMFYAHALGVDYQDGEYKLYVQILDFSTLGKTEGSGGKSMTAEGAWVGKGHGDTIQYALDNLYKTSQRRIYWGHLNTVILSESILKRGIHEVLDILTRYNELRYTLWVFGTRAPVEEVLLASPILESSPVYSQLGDPSDVYEQSSFIQPKRFYRFIVEMREAGKTALLPMINLSRGHWFDKEQKYSALEIEGAGMIKDMKWNGWLSREHMLGVRWLEQQTARTPLVIGSAKQPVAAMIFEHPKSEIVPVVRKDKVYYTIHINVKGSISEIGKKVSESSLKSRSEALIRDEIRQTFLQGVKQKVDILNLNDALYRKKLPEWRRLARSREIPLEASSLQQIDVHVQMTNSGRTLESTSDDRSGSSRGTDR